MMMMPTSPLLIEMMFLKLPRKSLLLIEMMMLLIEMMLLKLPS
jgi:hypothetical protein